MGITFKENCPDIRNSKVVDLICELESWKLDVKVVDPWADPEEVWLEYGLNLVERDDLNGLSAVVVAVGHNQFRAMKIEDFCSMCPTKGAVFGDLKSIYDREALSNAGFNVYRL